MPDEFVNTACCNDRREACGQLWQVKIDALNNIFETKLEAKEEARKLAARNLEKDIGHLNELRQMAQDRDLNFVTKDEFKVQVLNIEQLRLSEAKLAGKADQTAVTEVTKMAEAAATRGNLSIAIAIIVFIFSVLIHFIK